MAQAAQVFFEAPERIASRPHRAGSARGPQPAIDDHKKSRIAAAQGLRDRKTATR
jgi:hypothetical protein